MSKATFQLLSALLVTLLAAWPVKAQPVPRLITQAIDPGRTVPLPGRVRPEANAANDRGPVDLGRRLDHLQILLNRPQARSGALGGFLSHVNVPGSPDYHRWLTAAQFGERFGPSAYDVREVSAWLRRQGFTVNGVQPGRMMIDFSGTAAQVRAGFGVMLHRLDVGGVAHIANMQPPRIPAALAGIVRGIVSLDDFRPRPNFRPRPAYSFNASGQTIEALVPADMITIYDLFPLFKAGLSGQGQTIAVIEDSDVYDVADWTSFRAGLGLSVFGSGSLSQVHPADGAQNCADPGVVSGDESEATLDAQWASAAAPSAAIEVASCASSDVAFGALIALQNLVNSSAPPPIISLSYGACEAIVGAGGNAAYADAYQQAAAMGISVFVAAGDGGSDSCDSGSARATHGTSISGLASTAYNVAVGGTDFEDTVTGTNDLYWSAANSGIGGSAARYIPEIPWDDSCASSITTAGAGYAASTGTAGFCNSTLGRQYFHTVTGGGGGPSGCATGTPSIASVVSGSCQGTPKPSWQALVGNPADGVRDIPDVSLFAGDGIWLHYYLYCDSDTADGGAACTGAPSTWSGAGGTSFASPIMAGIQALIDQSQASSEGNPNPVYYAIARSNYGPTGSLLCLSDNPAAGACAFHDIHLGNNDVNCTGPYDCYQPGGQSGVLQPAYAAITGWDFATGIGSVDATNLVQSWAAGELLLRPPP